MEKNNIGEGIEIIKNERFVLLSKVSSWEEKIELIGVFIFLLLSSIAINNLFSYIIFLIFLTAVAYSFFKRIEIEFNLSTNKIYKKTFLFNLLISKQFEFKTNIETYFIINYQQVTNFQNLWNEYILKSNKGHYFFSFQKHKTKKILIEYLNKYLEIPIKIDF